MLTNTAAKKLSANISSSETRRRISMLVAAFTAATTFQSALALAEQLVQERENNDYPISFESEEQELAFYRNAARLAGLNVGSSLMLCAAAPW